MPAQTTSRRLRGRIASNLKKRTASSVKRRLPQAVGATEERIALARQRAARVRAERKSSKREINQILSQARRIMDAEAKKDHRLLKLLDKIDAGTANSAELRLYNKIKNRTLDMMEQKEQQQ